MKSDLIPLAEEKSNQSPSQPLPLLSLLLLRLLLKLPLQPLLLPLKPQLKKSGLVLNKSELVLNKLELERHYTNAEPAEQSRRELRTTQKQEWIVYAIKP